MHRVLIQPADYQTCHEAMAPIFAAFPLEVRGRRVLLKPNVLRATRPEEAVTTHPAVLRAVIDHLLPLAPASIVVGDNPGLMGYGANEASFERTGLLAAAGEHYRNIGLDAVEVPFAPEYGGRVSVSRAVLEADVVISLPKFKTHGLTVLTGAIKNSYGILPGAQKAVLHKLAGTPERFGHLVVEVFRLRVPDLFIMDAVLGMEGNGPAGTQLRWIGKLLAADNAVALDATMARMMGLQPHVVGHLRWAREVGLGDYSPEAIAYVGEWGPIPDFLVPASAGAGQVHLDRLQSLIDQRAQVRPRADSARCTACGTCIDQCPVQALTLADGLPQVDPELCIACFCCQEMCPEKAMALG